MLNSGFSESPYLKSTGGEQLRTSGLLVHTAVQASLHRKTFTHVHHISEHTLIEKPDMWAGQARKISWSQWLGSLAEAMS